MEACVGSDLRGAAEQLCPYSSPVLGQGNPRTMRGEPTEERGPWMDNLSVHISLILGPILLMFIFTRKSPISSTFPVIQWVYLISLLTSPLFPVFK